jgi:hypothetical protein
MIEEPGRLRPCRGPVETRAGASVLHRLQVTGLESEVSNFHRQRTLPAVFSPTMFPPQELSVLVAILETVSSISCQPLATSMRLAHLYEASLS